MMTDDQTSSSSSISSLCSLVKDVNGFSYSSSSMSDLQLIESMLGLNKRPPVPEKATSILLTRIAKFKEDGTFCDLVLCSRQGKKFPVHKLIMSSFGGFFADLLTSSKNFSDTECFARHELPVLNFPRVDDDLLAAIIDCCYGKEIRLSENRLPELLIEASELQLTILIDWCCAKLKVVLNMEICQKLFTLCWTSVPEMLRHACVQFACVEFQKIVRSSWFHQIPSSVIALFLLSDNLFVNSEEEVFASLLTWASTNYKMHANFDHLVLLLPLVRFPLMSALSLTFIQEKDWPFCQGDSRSLLCSLVSLAMAIHTNGSPAPKNRSLMPQWSPGIGCLIPKESHQLVPQHVLNGDVFACDSRTCCDESSSSSLYVVDWRNDRVLKFPDAVVVAGGNGKGAEKNQLSGPMCAWITRNESVFVVDRDNHRIMLWRPSDREGTLLLGGKGGELFAPSSIVVSPDEKYLFTADSGNHRVLVTDLSAAMNQNASAIKTEILCGGNGRGPGLHQLACPTDLCLCKSSSSLFCCDWGNHRVLRWEISLSSGRLLSSMPEIVAGGNGSGSALNQLTNPCGVAVSRSIESVFVADQGNDRVVLWPRGSQTGLIVVGGIQLPMRVRYVSGSLIVTQPEKQKVTLWQYQNAIFSIKDGEIDNNTSFPQSLAIHETA